MFGGIYRPIHHRLLYKESFNGDGYDLRNSRGNEIETGIK